MLFKTEIDNCKYLIYLWDLDGIKYIHIIYQGHDYYYGTVDLFYRDKDFPQALIGYCKRIIRNLAFV